jgi:hypothetical protein
MQEGLVMEIYKNYVVVMTNSGEFLKLRKKGIVNIGDIYKQKIYTGQPLYYYAAAALIIFVLTSFVGYNAYASQIVGYVDIKGTKSVRLYVNRKGTIQKVDGLEDTKEIKNLPVYKAVEKLTSIAPKEGLYNDESTIDVTSKKLKDSKLNFNEVKDKVKNIISNSSKNNSSNGKTQNDKQTNKDENKPDKNNNGNGNGSDKSSVKKDNSHENNGNGNNSGNKDKDKNNGSDKSKGNDKDKDNGNGNSKK